MRQPEHYLITKIKNFEKQFEELDKELQETLPPELLEEFDKQLNGFEQLRDLISDFEWLGSRLLEKLEVE